MMPVQYTYMAAIGASNTATATVLQFTSPAMVAAWLAATRRKRPEARDVAAVALAMLGTFFLAAHGRLGALSISAAALFWGLASAVAAAFNSLQPRSLRRHGAAVVAGWGMVIGGLALSSCMRPEGPGLMGRTRLRLFRLRFDIRHAAGLLSFQHGIGHDRGAEDDPAYLRRALSAAVLAVWWLGVTWGAMDWLGTACILATIILLAKEQSAETQAEKVT